MTRSVVTDVAVVGAGPAGLLTALCCSKAGLAVSLVGPKADSGDGRTAALFGPSITVLQRLGLWDLLAPEATPVNAIRLIDCGGALARAPEIVFRASEIGLDVFGYNIANATLTRCMEDAGHGTLDRIPSAAVDDLEFNKERALLRTREGEIVEAKLIAAADGRASKCRSAAGIGTTVTSYDQTALVTSFKHSRPHDGISTEFHRDGGPLTLVPGPGNTSSLVWVMRPEEAARLVALEETAFAAILRQETSALLGTLSNFSRRQSYPITGQTAERLAANRVALVGEAAHVLPPIGAQGLNLSFRDGAMLAEIAGAAKIDGRDPGGDDVLEQYERCRQPDTASRTFTIDLLNRSLLSAFPGAGLARGLGLFALSALPSLKAHVMRFGITPPSGLPTIMRGS